MKKYTEQVFENKKSGMTVGDLRKIIQDLDDNMRIGGSGHFGDAAIAAVTSAFVKDE